VKSVGQDPNLNNDGQIQKPGDNGRAGCHPSCHHPRGLCRPEDHHPKREQAANDQVGEGPQLRAETIREAHSDGGP
jgi:hypothetical protein